MAPPPGNPTKGKNRKWLLYAAGAGILLALLFFLRKGTPSPETSTGSALTAAEPNLTGSVGEGSLTPQPVTDAVPPPSLNLGPVNPGESVSARVATSGGEAEAARAREPSPPPESTATAARLAQVEGQYHKAEAEKAKLAATHKAPAASHSSKGHPASKPRHGHARAKPAKAPSRSRSHPVSKPAHHAAPKPHKSTKRR